MDDQFSLNVKNTRAYSVSAQKQSAGEKAHSLAFPVWRKQLWFYKHGGERGNNSPVPTR